MTPNRFLILNLALAFYNVGTIWAHEIDLFRTWKLIGPPEFHTVQRTHFKKLPYWIFTPVLLAVVGAWCCWVISRLDRQDGAHGRRWACNCSLLS